MKIRSSTIFVVLTLGVDGLSGDLNEGMVTSCTNKAVLSNLTGINRDRLAYIFTRKRRKVLVEADNLIIKVSEVYKGRQGLSVRYNGFTGKKHIL